MKASIFALLLVLAGCGGKTPTISTDTATARSGTVFLGDSITNRWDLNAYFPGKNYLDAGIEGQRTDEMLARLPEILSGSNVCQGSATSQTCQTVTPPNIVVIYAGWNNLIQGRDPQQAISDIQSMVQLCIARGAHPIVATIYHFDPSFSAGSPAFPDGNSLDGPADLIDQGIRQMNVPIVDLEQVFLTQSGYTQDGVHPIPAGYAQMRDAYDVVLTAPIQKSLFRRLTASATAAQPQSHD